MRNAFEKRILFVGMPDMALFSLAKLNNAKVNIVGVVPPPKGNGTHDFLCTYAKHCGLNVIPYDTSLKEENFLNKIRDLNADLAVVCSYNELFPKEFLESVKGGFINCHPSLLPDYRGANPYSHVIINGEKKTGVTLHFMNEKFDCGDIVAQQEIPVSKDETMGTLFNRSSFLIAEMLLTLLSYYEINGVLPRKKQPEGKFKLAPNICPTKGNNVIDWSKTSEEAERFVRALNPFILANTCLRGNCVKVITSTADNKSTKEAPGTVCSLKNGVGVATGSGILNIKILQFGSYVICDAEDFIRRFDPKIGERFQ